LTTIVIGLLLGLAIAFSLVFLLESLDRRIKTIEEFEREYRLPALASIPQSAFRVARAEQRTELLEPYRILRSALDFAAVARPLETLLVTSAVASEGKTTIAVDLAHAVALTGRRTVLVELDLRRPTFAQHFGLDESSGLTTALPGGAALRDLLVAPLHDVPSLQVLPAGRIPHNPSELLGSPRIGEVLAELASSEGLVIVDAPPLNPVADTLVLLGNQAIHAALIVARIDRVSRDEVRRARAILDRHIVEPVGIVVAGLRDTGGYGYGGAYRGNAPTLDADIEALSQAREGPASSRLRV
jgi:polysaccharide biosynthesis transport protein